MAKNIAFGTDARAKLAKGVNTLADAVTTTMAPRVVMLLLSVPMVLPPSPTMVFL